jgi:hypothetical protein
MAGEARTTYSKMSWLSWLMLLLSVPSTLRLDTLLQNRKAISMMMNELIMMILGVVAGSCWDE